MVKPHGEAIHLGERALARVLWGALVLVLLGVGGAGTWSLLQGGLPGWRKDAAPPLPVYGTVPDFALRERSGREVRGRELRGMVWIASFIYTHCPDTCLLQSAQMARLQAELATETDLRLVSITVDPGRDTPEVLARYADRFGADPDRWLFLTGRREVIHRLARETFRLGVVEAGELPASPLDEAFPPRRVPDREVRGPAGSEGFRARGRGPFGPVPASAHPGHLPQLVLHSSRFILMDRLSRIRGTYDSAEGGDLGRLRQHVRALLRAS